MSQTPTRMITNYLRAEHRLKKIGMKIEFQHGSFVVSKDKKGERVCTFVADSVAELDSFERGSQPQLVSRKLI